MLKLNMLAMFVYYSLGKQYTYFIKGYTHLIIFKPGVVQSANQIVTYTILI